MRNVLFLMWYMSLNEFEMLCIPIAKEVLAADVILVVIGFQALQCVTGYCRLDVGACECVPIWLTYYCYTKRICIIPVATSIMANSHTARHLPSRYHFTSSPALVPPSSCKSVLKLLTNSTMFSLNHMCSDVESTPVGELAIDDTCVNRYSTCTTRFVYLKKYTGLHTLREQTIKRSIDDLERPCLGIEGGVVKGCVACCRKARH